MSVAVKEGQDTQQLVRGLVKELGHEKAELIPILHKINGALGYISDEAIQELSELMKVPTSHIYSVATFYRMLSTEPRGRHVIQKARPATSPGDVWFGKSCNRSWAYLRVRPVKMTSGPC